MIGFVVVLVGTATGVLILALLIKSFCGGTSIISGTVVGLIMGSVGLIGNLVTIGSFIS